MDNQIGTSSVRQACDAFEQEQFQELAKNPVMINELFNKLKAEAEANGSTGVDGGFWFRFSSKIGDSITVQAENWKHFGDDRMFLLMQDYLQGLFQFHDYKNNENANILAPGFGGIQSALMNSSKLGFRKCFRYLMDNINIQDFDLDGVALLGALQGNHSEILIRLLINIQEANHYDTYGLDGSLCRMIQPESKTAYVNSTISDELYKELWKLKVLKE